MNIITSNGFADFISHLLESAMDILDLPFRLRILPRFTEDIFNLQLTLRTQLLFTKKKIPVEKVKDMHVYSVYVIGIIITTVKFVVLQ